MGYAGELGMNVWTESRMSPRSGTADTWGERAAGDGGKSEVWKLSNLVLKIIFFFFPQNNLRRCDDFMCSHFTTWGH